jgi:ketosteroid isomerase-like protein
MTCLNTHRIPESAPSRYATVTDFSKLFKEDRNGLYLLSSLLTANHEKAEQCFTAALDDCSDKSTAFQEWVVSRARQVIVRNAIHVIAPHFGQARQPTSAYQPAGIRSVLKIHVQACRSRRRNAIRLFDFSASPCCITDRNRSKSFTGRHSQSCLVWMVRWHRTNGRLREAASLQKHVGTRRIRWHGALLVARPSSLTLAIAHLVSDFAVILSIVFVLFVTAIQCSAQQRPGVQASSPTGIHVFQQIEDRWSEAINRRDQYALEQVLSPELIDISAIGSVTTRNQQIAMLFGKGTESLSLDQRVSNVRTFGDMAVVIGTYGEQRRVSGKLVSRNGMFTHIYQNVRSNWLCVSAQRTFPVESVPQKASVVKKQDDAEHHVANASQNTQ